MPSEDAEPSFLLSKSQIEKNVQQQMKEGELETEGIEAQWREQAKEQSMKQAELRDTAKQQQFMKMSREGEAKQRKYEQQKHQLQLHASYMQARKHIVKARTQILDEHVSTMSYSAYVSNMLAQHHEQLQEEAYERQEQKQKLRTNISHQQPRAWQQRRTNKRANAPHHTSSILKSNATVVNSSDFSSDGVVLCSSQTKICKKGALNSVYISRSQFVANSKNGGDSKLAWDVCEGAATYVNGVLVARQRPTKFKVIGGWQIKKGG